MLDLNKLYWVSFFLHLRNLIYSACSPDNLFKSSMNLYLKCPWLLFLRLCATFFPVRAASLLSSNFRWEHCSCVAILRQNTALKVKKILWIWNSCVTTTHKWVRILPKVVACGLYSSQSLIYHSWLGWPYLEKQKR